MVVVSLVKHTVSLLYQLTVGLTVLLLKALLYLLSSVAIVAALTAFVVFTTWTTYSTTGHLGWTAGACVLALLVCGVVVILSHRLAKDVLGLTSMTLGEAVNFVFFRTQSTAAVATDRCPNGHDYDSSHSEVNSAMTVTTRRRVVEHKMS